MLEDTVKQIRALLQNQLPAKLDQIELERADGVTLEDIQCFLIQEGNKSVHIKYPAIAIVGLETIGANVLSYRRELRHEVSIWIIDRVVSSDGEISQTRLLRYAEAVERVLALNPTLGGRVMNSVVTRHKYLYKGKEEFVRVAVLSMEAMERLSTGNY